MFCFLFICGLYISLSSKIDIFLGNQEHPNDLLVDRSADCNDRRHPLLLSSLDCPLVTIMFDVSFYIFIQYKNLALNKIGKLLPNRNI